MLGNFCLLFSGRTGSSKAQHGPLHCYGMPAGYQLGCFAGGGGFDSLALKVNASAAILLKKAQRLKADVPVRQVAETRVVRRITHSGGRRRRPRILHPVNPGDPPGPDQGPSRRPGLVLAPPGAILPPSSSAASSSSASTTASTPPSSSSSATPTSTASTTQSNFMCCV
jgi:hypothetical protein